MRPMFFAAGLALAATAVAAGIEEPRPDTYVTLTNGCVYAPNLLGGANEWSLMYTQAGTTVQCPLTIYGQINGTATPPAIGVPVIAAAEPAASVPAPSVAEAAVAPYVAQARTEPQRYTRRGFLGLRPGYMVGVFR